MLGIERFIILIIFVLSSCAHPSRATKDPTLEKAVVDAKILSTDDLEVKIEKTLHLINQDRYYFPKGPPQKLQPPFDEPYHLDSLRTPEQILEQKQGGFCGSAALVFSAILKKSGVKNEDLLVVEAVNAPDLELICPMAGQSRVEHPRTGASGHVFIAVQFANHKWRLINTVDGTNYESIDWFSPEELRARIKKGPVQIPFSIYKKFPPELRSIPMIVFQAWSPDEVPIHTFDQRLDFIASGVSAIKTCRYGAAEMAALDKYTMTSPLTSQPQLPK